MASHPPARKAQLCRHAKAHIHNPSPTTTAPQIQSLPSNMQQAAGLGRPRGLPGGLADPRAVSKLATRPQPIARPGGRGLHGRGALAGALAPAHASAAPVARPGGPQQPEVANRVACRAAAAAAGAPPRRMRARPLPPAAARPPAAPPATVCPRPPLAAAPAPPRHAAAPAPTPPPPPPCAPPTPRAGGGQDKELKITVGLALMFVGWYGANIYFNM
jgi:hypothetical protein